MKRRGGSRLLLLGAAWALAAGCSGAAVPAGVVRVRLPDGFLVRVETADTPEAWEHGLMGRTSLAPDAGMLFRFPVEGEYPFWMKNTLLPLDMVWMDALRKVVRVEENVPPCRADPCPLYGGEEPSRYVLEVGSGTARAHAVSPGTTLAW